MTEIEEYLNKKKDFLANLLEYFDEESHEISNITFFTKYYQDEKIKENLSEFKILLKILLNISCYHHRNFDFFQKLDQLLDFLKYDIKALLTNDEIFSIFKDQKRIILFLMRQKIFTLDLSNVKECYDLEYVTYFWPECKKMLEEDPQNELSSKLMEELDEISEYEREERLENGEYDDKEEEEEDGKEAENEKKDVIIRAQDFILKIEPDFLIDFEEKRLLGVNSTHIAHLIRNDLIEEFIIYVNKFNISLSKSLIKPSIFETQLSFGNEFELIEYAAFFGSIQIFNYLRTNGVKLDNNIWSYAIHGNNAEIIKIVEEEAVPEPPQPLINLLNCAIRCFHNDVANYFKDYPLIETENLPSSSYCNQAIKCYNFEFISTDLSNEYTMHLLCEYSYKDLLEILIKDDKFINRIGHKITYIVYLQYSFTYSFFLITFLTLFYYY